MKSCSEANQLCVEVFCVKKMCVKASVCETNMCMCVCGNVVREGLLFLTPLRVCVEEKNVCGKSACVHEKSECKSCL